MMRTNMHVLYLPCRLYNVEVLLCFKWIRGWSVVVFACSHRSGNTDMRLFEQHLVQLQGKVKPHR